MKKSTLLACFLTLGILHSNAQLRMGESAIFSENNRFNQNWSYLGADRRNLSTFTPFNGMVSANEIQYEVSVLYNIEPTSYIAIFHINQAADSAAMAERLLSNRLRQFINEANTLGITEKDIFTDMIALVPVYEKVRTKRFSKTMHEVPKGVVLQKNIHIRYSNPNLLDKLFNMAARHEIYDLIKVEYFTDSTERAIDKLRQKAVTLFKQKTDYFKKLGLTLDTLFHVVSEDKNVFFPIDRYTAYKPLSNSSVESLHGGSSEESDAASTAKYGYRAADQGVDVTTVFYNRIPYFNYDAVINSNSLIPTIQFSYRLVVKYTLQQPVKTITKNSFKFITPQGDVKDIPMRIE